MHQLVVLVLTASTLCCVVTGFSNVCTMDSQCYPNSCCASTGCTTTPPFCPAGLACAAPCVGPVPGCFEHTCGCNATSGSCVVKKIQPPSTTVQTTTPAVVPPTPVQTTTASTQAPNSNVCTMDSQCYPNSCCASTGCSTTPPFCPAGLACAAPCVGPVPGCFEHTCGCNATSGSCVVKKIQPPSPLLSTSSPVVTSVQTTIPPVTSVQSAVATPWPLLLAAGGAGFLVALVGVTCGVCLLRKSRRDVAAAAVAKKSAEVHLNDDHNDVCVAL